jgi:short-subunit dehydrogenase
MSLIVTGVLGYSHGVNNLWAMVTGASAGLGKEFARQLAAAGYNVVLVARNREALRALAEQIAQSTPVATEILVADLLNPEDRDRVATRVESTEHPVDVLVNNAGWGLLDHFHESTWPEEKDHLDIHVAIPLELTHRVLPGMRQRQRGRIIVVSSVAAFLSRGSYSAAKRYWVTMAKSLTAGHRKVNVSMTAVCPGFTKTEFHQRMGMNTTGVPRLAWLRSERVVAESMKTALRGRPVSIPTLRYRLFVALAPLIPARFHRVAGE